MSEPENPENPHLPQIDFGTFVMSLASSVLVHLGEIAHPERGAGELNIPLAKQTIDILGNSAIHVDSSLEWPGLDDRLWVELVH